VPFIRFARDKKGYESTCVMHAYRPASGPQRVRVLYVFRTPAHLKVGRQALDEEVIEALEHTHPDISFDWTALRKEPAEVRTERPERVERWERNARHRERRGSDRPPVPRAPAAPPVIEDTTILGTVLGASEAARLRQRYQEIGQRIARRARTPEDRDRLNTSLQRLNPDDWSDEASVRAGVSTLAADWDAITAELPGRRRGRRGGRGRSDGPSQAPGASSDPSGIMNEEGDADAHDEARETSDSRRHADEPRNDGPDGTGPDEGAGPAATAEASLGSDGAGTAPDLPGED